MDGSYDFLKRMSIIQIIKPRKNRVKWWTVEIAFSTFKCSYGEYCMSRKMENISKELIAKAFIIIACIIIHSHKNIKYGRNLEMSSVKKY
jgi:hypothetical protein